MLPWEQFAAHLAHGLLYVLIFAAPVSGWPSGRVIATQKDEIDHDDGAAQAD